jgi:predicted secreted protein
MRRLAALLPLLALSVPSQAGDFATRDIIGFSPDGGTFAFEEHGVQDGSGFAYSNIYAIDTASDEWLPGTPFRVLVEDETADPAAVRAENAAAARALLEERGVAPRGQHVASNPVSELSADPHLVVFNPRIMVPTLDEPITLRLEQFPLSGGRLCSVMGMTRGFALTLESGGREQVLHRDARLPESRVCPTSYRIGDVVTYFPDAGNPVLAVLVLMETIGFEGPDGRWLAVTAPLQ